MPNYEKLNSLWFHPETSLKVRALLESLLANRARVRIWLGDAVTGRAWTEEHDVMGRIGRSTGQIKVPLLVAANARGGPAILDHCIVRIDLTDRRGLRGASPTLYQHPSFHTGDWSVQQSDIPEYAETVLHNGTVHARFKKEGRGQRYVNFMTGTAYRM